MRSLVNPQNAPTRLGTPVIIRADGTSVPEGPSINVFIAAAIKTIRVQPIQSWCPSQRDRSFTLPIVGLTFIAMLSGCAGVRVTPLNPDGSAAVGEKEGMRYYMPAPYLLVTSMPAVPSSTPPTHRLDSGDSSPESAQSASPAATQSTQSPSPEASGVAPPRKKPNPSAPRDGDKTDGETSSTAPAGGAPSTNTSFLASTPQYMLKLVYLPDKTKPMAMSVRTGLFGTASMKPALQDRWMLTSLDASADSKAAETLTAIASLVSSATTAGAGGALKSAMATKANGQNLAPPVPPDFSKQILKPGLYKFVYDESSGRLTGLRCITEFTNEGVKPCAGGTGGK